MAGTDDTCFLFFSTSFTRFDNSSLISFSRWAKRNLFSAIISCTRIEDCHAETKELETEVRAGRDGAGERLPGLSVVQGVRL